MENTVALAKCMGLLESARVYNKESLIVFPLSTKDEDYVDQSYKVLKYVKNDRQLVSTMHYTAEYTDRTEPSRTGKCVDTR